MDENQYSEIIAMLTVIYKKSDNLERKAKGSTRMAPAQVYLDELRNEAINIINQIDG
jgi:hypothetical protein